MKRTEGMKLWWEGGVVNGIKGFIDEMVQQKSRCRGLVVLKSVVVDLAGATKRQRTPMNGLVS
jgi:hypothetical protein